MPLVALPECFRRGSTRCTMTEPARRSELAGPGLGKLVARAGGRGNASAVHELARGAELARLRLGPLVAQAA